MYNLSKYLGIETYIWNGSELITEEEYLTEASKVS